MPCGRDLDDKACCELCLLSVLGVYASLPVWLELVYEAVDSLMFGFAEFSEGLLGSWFFPLLRELLELFADLGDRISLY